MQPRILLFCAQKVIGEALVGLLNSKGFLVESGCYENKKCSRPVGLVLLVPWCSDLETEISGLKGLYPGSSVLVLLLNSDPRAAYAAFKAGAGLLEGFEEESLISGLSNALVGTISFSTHLFESMGRVMTQVPEGMGNPLTAREKEVLKLLSQGCSNRGIAQRLNISEHTARSHMRNLMGKLGVKNRVEAALVGAQL